MHLVYIDDSKDEKLACFSAISIPEDNWRAALDHLIAVRRIMKDCDGVRVTFELHATDWLGGRGNPSHRSISKWRRASLFDYFLAGIALLPSAAVFNAAVPRAQEERAFEWLINRINVNMSKAGSRAILISDEGKDYDFMLRRMRRFNYIPSRFGRWDGGAMSKNIPADRVLEDIVYRKSHRSLFIQAADCCAFSLIRRENPTAAARKYGFHQSLMILDRVLVKQANHRDPLGIIR